MIKMEELLLLLIQVNWPALTSMRTSMEISAYLLNNKEDTGKEHGKARDFDIKPYIRGNWNGGLSDPACVQSIFQMATL